METALSYLTVLPSTSDEIKRFTTQIINSVKEGQENPLKVLVMLRALEATAESIRTGIGEEILTEASKYSEKSFEAYGARIERAEVGVSYDYQTTEDREWFAFKVGEQKMADFRKSREGFLREIKKPITVIDPDTGEVYEIKPPLKKSKSGVKVFLH